MPKKKAPPESQKEQSERFLKAVSDAVAAGELNPTEANKALDGLVRRASSPNTSQKEAASEGSGT